MEISKKGLVFLASLEALSLTKYYDSVMVQTIGIGSTRSDIPDIANWPWDKELSVPEVLEYFQSGLKKYVAAVNKALKVEVTQEQFDAVVSICYNIGTGGMAGSTFIKRINAQAPDTHIAAAMMAWTKAGGKQLQGLVNRRSKEARLYRTGDYGDGKVLLIKVNPRTHKPSYGSAVVNLWDYLD